MSTRFARGIGAAAIGVALVTVAGAGGATTWQIDDLTPAASWAEATAVNAAGQVVGATDGKAVIWENGVATDIADGLLATAINDAGDAALYQAGGPPCTGPGYQAFVRESGVVTPLPTLGGTDAVAMGINADGVVVGASCPSNAPGTRRHAVRWDDGIPTDLGVLGSTIPGVSFATAVNDAGVIVGYSGIPGVSHPDDAQHAVLWAVGGSIVDLGVLPGIASGAANDRSIAKAINDDGLVVGSSMTSDGQTHAVLWTAETHDIVDIGTLGGGSAQATGVSDGGIVVGWSYVDASTIHAFAWSAETDMVDLGGLPGSTDTRANAVTEGGLVVGSSSSHAVSWTPGASSDANGDGIDDVLQPGGTPAGSFLDSSTDPETSGSIVDDGGLDVTITDEPDPVGVLVTVGAGGGAAVVLACGEEHVVDAGTIAEITCHSTIVTTRAGRVSVRLDGGLTVVVIPAGTSAEVSDTAGGAAVANVTGNGVVVVVDGIAKPIPPGSPTTTVLSWDFTGFLPPVESPTSPASIILNAVKAGKVVPLRWSLTDASGRPVTTLETARVRVEPFPCRLADGKDRVEVTFRRGTGLEHVGRGMYLLGWRTSVHWAGSCKVLRLDIGDGVTHDAYFRFTR